MEGGNEMKDSGGSTLPSSGPAAGLESFGRRPLFFQQFGFSILVTRRKSIIPRNGEFFQNSIREFKNEQEFADFVISGMKNCWDLENSIL